MTSVTQVETAAALNEADGSSVLGRKARTPEKVPLPRRRFKRYFRETGWRHLIGVLVGLFALFPLLYIFSASLNPGGTLLTANALFSNVSGESYVELFQKDTHPYGAWFVNTLVIGLITAAGTVILGALAAYSFSRMLFTGRRF